jgi:hypothetical protein
MHWITRLEVGCVVEREGKVAVVSGGAGWMHSIEPSMEISVFERLDEPATSWTDEKPRCEGAGPLAVTSVIFRGRPQWRADGTPWPGAKR